ncbi:hypothetical protein NDU88_002064, partial [Pleurodeles waltl]
MIDVSWVRSYGPAGWVLCWCYQRVEGLWWPVPVRGEQTVPRPTMVRAGHLDPVGQSCCHHCG